MLVFPVVSIHGRVHTVEVAEFGVFRVDFGGVDLGLPSHHALPPLHLVDLLQRDLHETLALLVAERPCAVVHLDRRVELALDERLRPLHLHLDLRLADLHLRMSNAAQSATDANRCFRRGPLAALQPPARP